MHINIHRMNTLYKDITSQVQYENRKLIVLKNFYECSEDEFKIMPVYGTNDYTLNKGEKFIDKFKPKLNKT